MSRRAESWEHVWTAQPRRSSPGRFLARLGDLQAIVYAELRRSGALRPGSAVLEVGCGTGPVLEMLSGVAESRFGVDVSPAAARLTSRHTQAAVADGRRLPFDSGSFDLVYSTGVLDLFEDEEAARFLAEKVRVLKSGGRAVAVTSRAGCRLHGAVMRHLVRKGRWRYGPKRTFRTLAPLLPADCSLVSEKGRGALFGLRFVSYLFEHRDLPRRLYHALFLMMSAALRPLNRLPGALLVTVLEKE